ncbi:helix-turn-helix transcriptional regulator [Denitratimonas sp. CY0512]|uniref:helix-turn-helix domain-containing protein n=1 Tax=Denitratimonas sp. CY0512 TaxID=3131940 RepID=UPI0030B34E41
MTQAIRSTGASSTPIRSFEHAGEGVVLETRSQGEQCKVYRIGEFLAAPVQVPVRHRAVGDLVARWEASGDRRAAIARARQWVAGVFHTDEGVTLRTLRMNKGMSQKKLADLIGTSQPHIARIEGGADNLSIDTCRRLAQALDIDMNALDAALKQQESLKASTR